MLDPALEDIVEVGVPFTINEIGCTNFGGQSIMRISLGEGIRSKDEQDANQDDVLFNDFDSLL